MVVSTCFVEHLEAAAFSESRLRLSVPRAKPLATLPPRLGPESHATERDR